MAAAASPNESPPVYEDLSDGVFPIADIDQSGLAWLGDFLVKYADLPTQLADASVMYAAERHDIDTIFTLDRRDFTIYRFSDGRAPKLLPG